MTPLFRKGDSEEPQNCRPISLTWVHSKLFANILTNQLNKFLDRFDLITQHQFGFSSKVPITAALVYCTKSLPQEIDLIEFFALDLLDFSKAFNYIHYNMFEKKLFGLCYDRLSRKMLIAFTSNRIKRVRQQKIE